MNLTPCPEGKHVWANVMRNGGNAVRNEGTVIDELLGESVKVFQKSLMAVRERGHSQCQREKTT